MQVSQFQECPPAGVNGAASVVAHAAKPGQRAGTIKRGSIVSVRHDSGPIHLRVSSVRKGVVELETGSGSFYGFRHVSSVEVVAPPKLSNLDLCGRLVKKGCKVSYHGVRGVVAKVSRGRCCVEYMHFTGRPTGSHEWLVCESLQVVS